MSKKLNRKDKFDLPYWPSEEFMRNALGMIREKGVLGTDEEIYNQIRKAYWNKRAKLLAEQEMEKYEKGI